MLLLAGAAPPYMTQATIVVVAGALVAYAASRAGLVPIVGFLLTGVLIGPHALGLVRDPAMVDAAAEIGVILLLFTIGVEFSFERLNRIRRLILGGGTLQVMLATGCVVAALAAWGTEWRAAVFTGFLVALSSTAIVLKLLEGRGETNTERGRGAVGLLIFQDLAIIPMVLLTPALGGGAASGGEVGWALLHAAALIVGVLVVARRVMPPLMERVARTCSPEVFLLSVVAVCFGTAYLTSLAGVSLSLGAFLAGLVVSESRFSEQALGEILPLQIVFSATFFVSVGMLLDVGFLVRSLPLVLAAVAGILVVKLATTWVSLRLLGYAAPSAAATALLLAQVGEFSFVLERVGREAGLSFAGLGEAGSQTFISAAVVLMIATPLLAAAAARVPSPAPRAAGPAADGAADDGERFAGLEGHVVIAGYGAAARRLAAALVREDVPFVVTTLSPPGAAEAQAAGYRVLLGDSTRAHTLLHVGAERAGTLVVADDEPATARRIVAVARSLNEELRIVVRTRYAADVEELERAGATVAVAEEVEGMARMMVEVLPPSAVLRREDAWAEPSAPREGMGSDDEARAASTEVYGGGVDRDRAVVFRAAPGVPCGHVAAIRPVQPGSAGCEECLALGARWVHLRICLSCGHVGCCDSSPHRHATAHHHATGHPVMASLEPGEDWGWCYVDGVTLPRGAGDVAGRVPV